VGLEDITASARDVAGSDRAKRRAEKAKAPAEARRARALLRRLTAIGPRQIADVRRAFREAGCTVEQLEAAAEELQAIVCVSTKRGPGARARLLRLPSADNCPARTIAETPSAVRREITRDIVAEETREREATERMLRVAVPEEGRERQETEQTAWVRAQLVAGPRRLGDLRREMPAPELSDQAARDLMFMTAARAVGVVVRPHGPKRLRGFWLELAPSGSVLEDGPLLAAMQGEGSPHIAYPKPRHWY
jgi:hypothetical protein